MIKSQRNVNSVYLSCIVPAYNEVDNLPQFIPALIATIQPLAENLEIVIIDDGSTDNTVEVVCALLPAFPCVRLLQLSRNFGKESALTAGIDAVKGNVVLLIDADFQHPLSAIPTMLNLWLQGYDMIYGIRNRQSESRLKRILTRWFYWLIGSLSSIHMPADAGDFRLMDRKVIQSLQSLPERTRYMKGLYAWIGFKSIGVQFEESDRLAGQSKFNFKSLFKLAMSGITAFSDIPLRLAIYFGVVFAVIALGYGVWIVIETMVEGVRVPGWSTIAAGMMFIGALELLFIGIIGEYIARIYNEVKARPKYIVAEEFHHPKPDTTGIVTNNAEHRIDNTILQPLKSPIQAIPAKTAD